MLGLGSIYYVDSDKRESGTSEDFTYKIHIPPGVDSITLLQMNIPKSYYAIQSGLNTFTLDEDGTQSTITLGPGNYTARELAAELQTQINASKTDTGTYTVLLNATTGKFTFTLGSPSTTTQKFIIGSNGLHKYIGFNSNSENTFTSYTLTSVNVINLERSKSLYLKSDICINQTKHGNNTSDSVFQEIFVVNSQDYGFIGYQNPYPLINAKKLNRNSDIFTFKITDTDDQILDLNGVELVFSVLLFKSDDYNKLKKEMLKIDLQG